MNIRNFYKLILFGTIFLPALNSCAQNSDTLKKKQHFELSFGQSLLFISESQLVNARNKEAVILPTSAILFFANLRPQKKISIPLFFNIPTETKQFLDTSGKLINEKANPTYGFGLEFKLFQILLDETSNLEFRISPLASFTTDKKNRIRGPIPILAARIRLMKGENFTMYIGGSYSFLINSWGILYGTGAVF